MINTNNVEAMLAFDNGNYKEAKELFAVAIENDPTHPENHFFLGQTLFFCKEIQPAIASLTAFIDLKEPALPENTDTDDSMNVANAYDTLGQCYEAENNSEDALPCYEKATKTDAKCASAWNNMGLYYLGSAEYCLEQNPLEKTVAKINELFKGAQLFIKKALDLFKTNPAFLHSMARWFEKYTDMIKLIISDAISAQEQITIHFKLAIELYQKARITCGDKNLTLRDAIITNYAECYAQYGHHIYRSKQYPEAQKLYLKAIELDPNHLNAISQMGTSYSRLGKQIEARNYFTEILGKTSDTQTLADAHYNIAYTYRLDKNWTKAEEFITKALQLSPLDEDILEEQATLAESKLQAMYISSPQIMFASANTGMTVSNEKPEPDNQTGKPFGL